MRNDDKANFVGRGTVTISSEPLGSTSISATFQLSGHPGGLFQALSL